MAPQIKLELYSVINSLPENERNVDGLKKRLESLSTNIMVKEFENDDRFLLANHYTKDNKKFTSLERECRSIILDKTDLRVVCYTYDDIYYNDDARNWLLQWNGDDEKKSTDTQIECSMEGTFMPLYFYNGKWCLSTRKCIDAATSIWSSNKSYYDMFVECFGDQDGVDKFYGKLDKNYIYYFVLVHHENKYLINYSEYFKGDQQYKVVYHVLTRECGSHGEVDKSVVDLVKLSDGKIQIPTQYKDYTTLDKENESSDIREPIAMEGVIVKLFDKVSNKTVLLKIQTDKYKKMSIIYPNSSNMYYSFIELYQRGKLVEHIKYFPENNRIYNKIFEEDPYDTIGVIDATFKVLTSELFELFKIVWNIRDCSHNNDRVYKILPSEYTTVLYKIRGIYYKKKEQYITMNYKNVEKTDQTIDKKNSNLRICDIYNLLKTYDTKDLIKLLSARKKLKYLVDTTDEEVYRQTRQMSNKCDRISKKMIAILLNNMFPELPEKVAPKDKETSSSYVEF
ncbi:MAG: RNA ligase [Faunusvirus sp.]|jgi:hypothetical protein|uniref:RNA ligase n=1 Tax=Faunusvirus sp. TaxID=2487766 RepID=A0A3G4ZZZ5_9VIRU|nr:MAG: RNA ligase [Faunusvirus sp.]